MEPIYRPQHKEEQSLIEDFVIREREYRQLIESVNADKPGKAPQHIILQGVRGMGKTTLMYRAFYELNNRYREQGIIPVIFSEEQYSVRALYKLWEEIAQYLEENEPAYSGILQKMERLESTNDDAYEEQSFELLKNEVEKQGHRLVLFIDNFGVMVDKFKKRDQQRLREILIDFPRIKIIGGSAVVLESFYRYDKPFFEFFKVLHLDKLNTQEVQTMLKMLGKRYGNLEEVEEIIQNQPGRVESLRILTNGVPRTIVLLFNIFLDNINGNSIDDLKQLLDRVTPLYQQRMDNLPPQQQEIVEKLALNWDGMSVAELRQKTRMSSKAISAQLRNLEKSQVITSVQSSGKNKFYQLEERFFNIWYLMQHAPRSYKKKVIWLTRFLELWCEAKNLKENVKKFKERLKEEVLNPEYTLSLVYAYAQASGVSRTERDELIENTQKSLQSYNTELIKFLPEKTDEFNDRLKNFLHREAFNEAKALIEQTPLPKNISEYLIAFVKEKAQQYKEAEEHYLKAIELENVKAIFNLGNLYTKQDKLKNAEKYYLMAIQHDDARAMFNLGLLYARSEKFENAEKYYLMAIEHGQVEAMFNLGNLCHGQDRFKDAEHYYLMAIEHNNVKAMFNLAILYEEKEQLDKAEKYYLKAIENDDVRAMFNLSILYEKKEQLDKAEKYYLKAIEHNQVKAMNNLALLYKEKNNFKDAERCLLMALKYNSDFALGNLMNLYMQNEQYDKIQEAKTLIENHLNCETDLRIKLVIARFLLWANQPDEALPFLKKILPEIFEDEQNINLLGDLLAFAIAKGLRQAVLKLFNQEDYQLKDRLKVVYYALMKIMEDEYPNEIRKMGKELEEPVNEMVDYIKELEEKHQ